MTRNVKALLFAAALAEICSGTGLSCKKAEATEDKTKWEMTIDVIMIVGKYLESNRDFVNLMKLTKKYIIVNIPAVADVILFNLFCDFVFCFLFSFGVEKAIP